MPIAATLDTGMCSDCPPDGYPTDKTRCRVCPRRRFTTEADARAAVLGAMLEGMGADETGVLVVCRCDAAKHLSDEAVRLMMDACPRCERTTIAAPANA